jgi:hypothetical protein
VTKIDFAMRAESSMGVAIRRTVSQICQTSDYSTTT